MYDYVSCYNLGVDYKKKGDFMRSAEYHVKAMELNPAWDLPEAWHNAGAALLRIQKTKAAKPFLEKALFFYEQRLSRTTSNEAYYNYWKSCVLALLEQRGEALRTLKKAIELKGAYVEDAAKEEDFKAYFKDPDFLFIVQGELDVRRKQFFRGDALSKDEMSEDQLKYIKIFNYILKEHDWDVEDFELMMATGLGMSPQAKASFKLGTDYLLHLSMHLDTYLLFLELEHRHNSADLSPFRLYYDEFEFEKQLPQTLNMIAQFQDGLNELNKKGMIQALIPHCQGIFMEMPDGEKVKIRG